MKQKQKTKLFYESLYFRIYISTKIYFKYIPLRIRNCFKDVTDLGTINHRKRGQRTELDVIFPLMLHHLKSFSFYFYCFAINRHRR